jgi:hypothetical protein
LVLELGARAFLPKRFSMDQLRATLRRIFGDHDPR